MKFKLLLTILLLSFFANAQHVEGHSRFNKMHTTFLGSESVNPLIISQIQIPLNTKTHPSLSLQLKSNSGNTMIHETDLKNKNGGDRTIYFNAVLEKTAIVFTYPFHEKMEIFMEMSLISSSRKGIYNPMSWAVQDNFIEGVHNIAGKTDIYKREALGFDAFSYEYNTESGNQYKVTSNSVFLIPFLIGTNYYEVLFQNDKKIISANATLSLKVPLKSPRQLQALETGVGVTINKTKMLRRSRSFTTSAHASFYYHELAKSSDYISLDNTMSYKLSGLLGLNFMSKNSNTLSFFTALNKTSSRLNADNYYLTFDNFENRQALAALTQGNEYLDFGGNYTFHFKNKNNLTMEVTFREDLNFYRGFSKILKGRNAEDFGVFIGFKYVIR